MKKSVLLAIAIVGLATAPAFAATKSYQVTGPVTAMTDDSITVQKGSEKWEIAKGTAGVPADVKIGSKVTVQYSMTADSVVSKPASPVASSKSSSTGTGAGSSTSASSGASAPGAAPGSSMQPAMATGSSGTPTANK